MPYISEKIYYAWRADILEQRALRESDGNGGQYSAPGIKLRMRGWAASAGLCLADTVMMLPWTSTVCCGLSYFSCRLRFRLEILCARVSALMKIGYCRQ